MRRLYAYLLQQCHIDWNVLDAFVHAGLIYESRKPSKGGNDFHNAAFVGLDERGVPRHAHKRGLYSAGPGLKRNVGGCDPRYSFHYTGTSDRLYVFEARSTRCPSSRCIKSDGEPTATPPSAAPANTPCFGCWNRIRISKASTVHCKLCCISLQIKISDRPCLGV